MFEHFRLNVDVGQTPMRVDKYMATHLEDTSRHRVQCAIKEGYVRVNDKVAEANLIIRPGDVIRFVMPYRRRGLEILPQDIPLNIVYEDNDLLVVNKAAGMVVHPGHGHFEGTLRQRTLLSFRDIPGSGGRRRADGNPCSPDRQGHIRVFLSLRRTTRRAARCRPPVLRALPSRGGTSLWSGATSRKTRRRSTATSGKHPTTGFVSRSMPVMMSAASTPETL